MKTIVAVCLVLIGTEVSRAALDITALYSAFTENFDTLANSGTSSTVPAGWGFSESGANANTTYTAGTGSDNTGDTYSFGASGSTERAFGGLRSGSLVPTIGVQIQNKSGNSITSFIISYVGEQWRFGGEGSNRGSSAPDRLDFQYSTDATSLTSGTWQNLDTLDFSSRVFSGSAGALNGNASANRTTLEATLGGITIANNGTIWFRWNDYDVTGSDDGLAIDDFSVTAIPEPVNVALAVFGGIGAGVWGVRRFVNRRKPAHLAD